MQSTPEKNGQSDDASRSPELLQEFKILGSRKDLPRICLDKEKKHSASSKCKMLPDHIPKSSKKTLKNQELRNASINPKNQLSKKHSRKAENPSRIPVISEQSADFRSSTLLVCQNSACRATLNTADTFCKRCSCCICHLFDDNKDPSLWLECASVSGEEESCGLSCHIECAFQRGKLGVVNLGQLLQLDGSYCCASCGKVSGILGCWKKQLSIARDARRVDILCSRVDISFRLLDGTSTFKDLHEIVSELKAKLDNEVGPVTDVSGKMARGIVSRLSIASDVQTLCTLAIEKADEWFAAVSSANPNCIEGSLPAACKFLFEEVTSSSVVIVLIELPTLPLKDILGYNLWYCKTREESYTNEPVCVFPRSQRRLLISNLLPCTEYSFRIVSYTEAGDLGHSEATCFTKSVEIIYRSLNKGAVNRKKESSQVGGSSSLNIEHKTSADVEFDSGFKVRDLGRILRLAWAQEQGCLDGLFDASTEKCCGASDEVKPGCIKDCLPPVSRELDLNVASVPDLNEELIPPVESSRDEDNECTLERAVGADDDAVSHDNQGNGVVRSHGSGDSQNWTQRPTGEVSTVNSQGGMISRKRAACANEETYDCDSTLINGSPSKIGKVSGSLDENFEYCVKIMRWLECEGYINQEFRKKLLTWFSLRSTEQERRVVNTFIRTLIDDPSSLAGQLVDSFSDMVSNKRAQNGFCSKLWH